MNNRGEFVITYIEMVMAGLIIILATLLIVSYTSQSSCEPSVTIDEQADVQGDTAAAAAPETPPPTTPTTPAAASCTDTVKNQDETDVDCGGTACRACADGKACTIGADCLNTRCVDRTCSAAATYTDTITFSIDSPTYNATGNTPFLITLPVTITNDRAEPFSGSVKVYVKTEDDEYLNQKDRDSPLATYATLAVPTIQPGETYQQPLPFAEQYTSSKYLSPIDDLARTIYRKGDSFKLEAQLVDGEGTKIGVPKIKLVHP